MAKQPARKLISRVRRKTTSRLSLAKLLGPAGLCVQTIAKKEELQTG